MLQPAEADDRPDVARVHFFAGAVSNWHSHPGGQHLLLLAGRGRFGLPGARARAGAGRLPRHAAGERHFHGAASGRRLRVAGDHLGRDGVGGSRPGMTMPRRYLG